MAGSRFEYVKGFELPDPLLPGTFLLYRLDGHSFHRLSDVHSFQKPSDERALKLMDHAARELMDEYTDIVLAFGESDEFSFLLRKSTALYNRRHAKIVTTLTSYFTSSYVLHWPEYFPNTPLRYPPSFDGRIVLYPSEKEVRDYFAWRQADTHINNLYNTAFWALVQQGEQSTKDAHETLRGTVSSQKHEMLFNRFGINYNILPERFRKGSVLVREENYEPSTDVASSAEDSNHPTPETKVIQRTKVKKSKKARARTHVVLYHCDIIGDAFWNERPWLLCA
ncbi:tRNAHis guanylyltransferase [Dentipellis sp. KUC8613]|nr:tRNAHis guanylyltransferase [Dentipellis sp. KUC8613]